jgi:hypothetical protein
MRSKGHTLVFVVALLAAASLGNVALAQDKPKKVDQIDSILDSLFEASQSAVGSFQDKGEELKDRLNSRLDESKAKAQAAISGVGNIVGSTADLVADTTKLVAEFLTEDLQSVEEVKESFKSGASGLRETVATMNSLVQKFAMILHTAAPKLPSWETIKNPKEWPASLMSYTGQVSQAFTDLAVETTKVYDGISAKYCTPSKIAPSVKKQGKIEGPSFKLVLSSGECEFSHTNNTNMWNKETQVTCKTPSINFLKTPFKYMSKHHSPILFKSKECKREHALGEESEITLFEISPGLDISTALQQASQRIQDSFDGILGEHEKLTSQLKSFADEMVDNMDEKELSETVAKYDEAALEVARGMVDGMVSFSTGSGQSFPANGMISLPGGWSVNMNANFEE